MIPIPISAPQILVLFLLVAVAFFFALLLPTILELKRPKDAGPRRIFESDGKEIIDFRLSSAIFPNEHSRATSLFLEDIEPQEFEPTRRCFFFLSIPDIEF